MSGLRAELIGDAGALAALAPAWWALWRHSPRATPFQSPAWLLSWWGAFAPGKLFTIAVWAGERLVGLAPLYLETSGLGRRLLPIGISLSDYVDFIVDPTCEAEAGTQLWAALARRSAEWDEVALDELGPAAMALAVAPPSNWRGCVSRQSACPVLEAGASGRLTEAIPKPQLRKLRMARHRLERRNGKVASVAPGRAEVFLAGMVRLHQARWSTKGEAGVLDSPAVRGFHRSALPGLLEAGLARLFSVEVEGRMVGAYYGLAHRQRAYAYLGGFDPEFAFESPGTVLIGHAIEAAEAEGALNFDFLRGREAYKYAWGAVDSWTSRRTLRIGA